MKVRVISAIVMIAILIPIIYFGGYVYAGAAGILSILAYKEILDLKKSHNKIPVVVKILGLLSLCYLVLGNIKGNALLYKQMVLPLIAVLLPTIFYKKDHYKSEDALYLLGSIYLIGLFFNALITIRSINIYILIYLISITVFADTFAYAIGCLIGKHKMCPKISPKKSWEGAIAGLIGGVAIALIVYSNLIAPLTVRVILVTIILNITGQIGDLFYSKIKRENDIKDFSNIIPGHGGILDRLDSLCFVVFMYVLLIWTF